MVYHWILFCSMFCRHLCALTSRVVSLQSDEQSDRSNGMLYSGALTAPTAVGNCWLARNWKLLLVDLHLQTLVAGWPVSADACCRLLTWPVSAHACCWLTCICRCLLSVAGWPPSADACCRLTCICRCLLPVDMCLQVRQPATTFHTWTNQQLITEAGAGRRSAI